MRASFILIPALVMMSSLMCSGQDTGYPVDLANAPAFKDAYSKAMQGDAWSMLWIMDEMSCLNCAQGFYHEDIIPLLKMLSTAGDVKAKTKLAMLKISDWSPGKGYPKEPIEMLEGMTSQGYAPAMLELALILHRNSWEVPRDEVRSKNLALKAFAILRPMAEAGDKESLRILSSDPLIAGITSSEQQFGWLKKLCELGDFPAMVEYFDAFKHDSDGLATQYLQKAVEGGEWRAVLAMGQALELGDCYGIPQNIEEAWKYYEHFAIMTGSHELLDEMEMERERIPAGPDDDICSSDSISQLSASAKRKAIAEKEKADLYRAEKIKSSQAHMAKIIRLVESARKQE